MGRGRGAPPGPPDWRGVLVPWAATGGEPFLAATDKVDAERRIDAILERVRRGEDR